MNRSAISTATLSKPPGLPLKSITSARIPWLASVLTALSISSAEVFWKPVSRR